MLKVKTANKTTLFYFILSYTFRTNMNCIWRLDLELGFRNKKKYHSHQIQLKIPQFKGSKHDRVNLRNRAQALARTQNVSAQGSWCIVVELMYFSYDFDIHPPFVKF